MILKNIKLIYYFILRYFIPWYRFLVFRLEDVIFYRRRRLVVNCLGDSHTAVFKSYSIRGRGVLQDVRLRVTTVTGATAFGLSNPNSKTNAIKIFKRELNFIPKNQMLVLLLGEVDCGFLVWYRAAKYGTSVEVQMKESLRRYADLLKYASDKGLVKVAVFSVPPPTIGDGCQSGLVANQRKSITATQLQRTHMTQKYNAELKKIVFSFGFDFIDVSDELIDSDTGLVRPELKNNDASDHHLDSSLVAPIYASGLKRFIDSVKCKNSM